MKANVIKSIVIKDGAIKMIETTLEYKDNYQDFRYTTDDTRAIVKALQESESHRDEYLFDIIKDAVIDDVEAWIIETDEYVNTCKQCGYTSETEYCSGCMNEYIH